MQMNRDGKSRAVMLILQMALYILGILEDIVMSQPRW